MAILSFVDLNDEEYDSDTDGFTCTVLSNKVRYSSITKQKSPNAARRIQLQIWRAGNSFPWFPLWHSEGQENSCEPPPIPADPRCSPLCLTLQLFSLFSHSTSHWGERVNKKKMCSSCEMAVFAIFFVDHTFANDISK